MKIQQNYSQHNTTVTTTQHNTQHKTIVRNFRQNSIWQHATYWTWSDSNRDSSDSWQETVDSVSEIEILVIESESESEWVKEEEQTDQNDNIVRLFDYTG